MGTLTYGVTEISIPDDMAWPGEFAWPAVAQKKTYSVTGSLIVESGLKKAGRTIVLQSGDTFAWMPREDVVALREISEVPGAALSLEFRGQTFDVVFDHETGAMESQPIVDFSDPSDADFCSIVLRFIKV